MNSAEAGAREGPANDRDVLTVDEEGVLSSIRSIVMAVRSGEVGAGVVDVERALIAAGGVRLGEKAMQDVNSFALRGACFSIASGAGSPESIEVKFIRASR